jgi:hypothetical protein
MLYLASRTCKIIYYTSVPSHARLGPPNHVMSHVFRLKVRFCNRDWCVSFLFWLAVFVPLLFHYTYTYTYTFTYTINQLSTMSTQQQSSLKSITTDEVAKVSLFHARPYATI